MFDIHYHFYLFVLFALRNKVQVASSVHVAKVVKQAEMYLAVIKRTMISNDVAVFF